MSAARCSTTSTPSVGRGDVLGVADVAEDEPRPARRATAARKTSDSSSQPRRAVGVVEAERPHVRAVAEQPLDDVAADEAVRPRDEHGLAGDRSVDGTRGQFACHSGLFVVLSFVIMPYAAELAAAQAWPFARARSLGVPTSIQSLLMGHAVTTSPRLEAGLDEVRHLARPARGEPGERTRLDGIHGGVDVEAQRRLLGDAGDATVGALDDAEGHLVLVGARRQRHGRPGAARGRRAGRRRRTRP